MSIVQQSKPGTITKLAFKNLKRLLFGRTTLGLALAVVASAPRALGFTHVPARQFVQLRFAQLRAAPSVKLVPVPPFKKSPYVIQRIEKTNCTYGNPENQSIVVYTKDDPAPPNKAAFNGKDLLIFNLGDGTNPPLLTAFKSGRQLMGGEKVKDKRVLDDVDAIDNHCIEMQKLHPNGAVFLSPNFVIETPGPQRANPPAPKQLHTVDQ